MPDNRVLSHDLIEGCFARSGVVSDVELFEGLPARFLAEMGRRHRWIRGDWQIAAWLFNRVPAAHGSVRNTLDALARWKIFDNLRRSLVPPMLLGFLLAAWTLLPHLAGYFTLLALLLASGQPVAGCVYAFLRRPPDKPAWLHLRDQGGRLLKVIACEAFSWCVLPYVAYSHADAVLRTLYRLRVSHRGLLEWMTASEAEARCPDGCRQHFAAMWPCIAIGAATAAVLTAVNPHVLLWCAPLLAAWLAGPLVAWWTSGPYDAADASPANVSLRQVRRWARQTWHYFECFAGAGGKLASAGQRAVAFASGRGLPHQSNQYRHGTAFGVGGLRFRLSVRHELDQADAPRRWLRSDGWSAGAGTSTTGTTLARSSRWSRAMSRASIAETCGAPDGDGGRHGRAARPRGGSSGFLGRASGHAGGHRRNARPRLPFARSGQPV